jgi:molybdopterin-guanine dinucleotide biosynthesis protein A
MTQIVQPPLQPHEIGGVILAGGKSSRLGGGDKGLLSLDDQSMLAHVISRLKGQVAKLAINASGDAARFAQFNLPVFPDATPTREGPLAGVLAGIEWAKAQPGLRAFVTVSTDAPFIPPDLVKRLSASGAPLVCAVSHAHVHPTISLWPLTIGDSIRTALAEGRREMMAFVVEQGARLAIVPETQVNGQSVDPMFNVNTPEELDSARRILQSSVG